MAVVEALIWGAVIFAAGGILTLERRCLGQMAVVQPLVVCLLMGWILGCEDLGIWLGISLQLFSVSQRRKVDWALGGVVSAVGMVIASRFDFFLVPGSKEACTILLVAALMGLISKRLDRRYARVDGERLREHSPLSDGEPARAVESLVHSVILRWLLVGGVEALVGVGLIIAALKGVSMIGLEESSATGLIAAVVPSIGAAMALGSLAEYRVIAWTGLLAALTWVVVL